ncbi:DUF3019 domain-containing protein [Rheinheimera sp. UJ51]|uniref:DUF3019 domain-containing protein n=1 Tax=Rheinheimera sp. UJ51 TaxID=2892446 RepID=UPI001E5D3F71|nr:DUF3019 domain-containing protein [Rheinheimera sp. UJ51]MCC5452263.1 DUF3019 domain-containing protein [Rheinheimera sp. UJ51]
MQGKIVASLGLILTTWWALPATAKDLDDLILTPNLCVVTDEQPVCQLNLSIEYQAPLTEQACLWRSDDETPLSCYAAFNHVSLSLFLSIKRNTMFRLLDMNANLIAQAEFTTAKYNPVKSRRRRGLGWNL